LHHSLNQGCHVYGWLEVSKVTGNFHIAPGSSVKDVHVHVHNLHQLGPSAFNTSHTIKHFSFGQSFPGKKFPLDGETVIANKGGVMVHYFVKIVPTVYVDLKQNRLLTHQFSVTKSKLDIDVNSPDGLPGFFVSYEFSPLMVQLNEKEKPFTHFLTDICVIVGGVFTVASLIDSFLYHSSRKLAEKIRQGKFN
ncbi:Endoplasmic reticulum-Golgi intermediate compartment protein 3, partial [Trichinella zimbabwensis]